MSDIQPRALVEAAAWRSHLAERDGESTASFEAWLAADSQNIAAWKQIQGAWDLYGQHATAPEIIMLRRAALTHAHKAGRDRWAHSRRLSFSLGAAIAASIVALVGMLAWQLRPTSDVYQTRAGERGVEMLADGSQIALDSESEVRVRYSAHARDLILIRGQARFDVAHDVQRPFSVIAEGHRVVATGTSFNMDLFGPKLLVTLIEGQVSVWSDPAPAARETMKDSGTSPSKTPGAPAAARSRWAAATAHITLDAGEQLIFVPDAPPKIAHVNLDRETAWQNGELIFKDEPLSSVVARINRYARHPVLIGDAATAALRISGVFHTGDERGFVTTIVSYLPVRALEDKGGATRLLSAE
jgi:transmembrane sensor